VQKELAELPKKIELLENEQTEINTQMGNADFYQQAQEKITEKLERLKKVEAELAEAYKRWGDLEG
jgi:ATP-binding cassette subfamily F protein uup